MKTILSISKKLIKLVSMLSVVFVLMSSNSVMANDVQITLSENECQISLSTAANGCDAGQCDGDSECVCAAKGDFITWSLAGGDKFKMKFSSNSPLKDNCGKEFGKDSEKCKIKDDVVAGEEYSYEVILEKCAAGKDPRIIIRT